MGNKTTGVVNISSYQSFSGSNTSYYMGGTSTNFGPKGVLYAGAGVSTNYTKDSTGLVAMVKYTVPISEHAGLQLRSTTVLTEKTRSTQLRVSPTLSAKVGKNTSIYTNPYYAYKISHNNKPNTHSIGSFTGVTQSFGEKLSASVELQCYDLLHVQKYNPSNYSVNLTVSYKF